MPKKLAVAALKAALQDSPEAAKEFFKKKFTPGFYHGSPSNEIKAFDPYHAPSEAGTSADAAGEKFSNAVFLTRDPSFANSFLPTGKAMGYKPNSTIYPVSANLGKHFDHETPEGKEAIKHFLSYQYPINPEATKAELKTVIANRANVLEDLNRGSWTAVESPEFQDFLRQNAYDSFATVEAGRKNVGIFEPHNIRGKFGKYNPAEEFNPDFMKAKGGSIDLPEGGDLLHQQVPSNLPNVNLSVHGMPSMNGMPGIGYMQTPQGAMARMQLEKELADNARMRAAVSASAMAIPGLHGVKTMPGQIEAGYNAPIGPGRADIGAFRTINPIPGKGHIQGVNARYTIPFKKGGKVS